MLYAANKYMVNLPINIKELMHFIFILLLYFLRIYARQKIPWKIPTNSTAHDRYHFWSISYLLIAIIPLFNIFFNCTVDLFHSLIWGSSAQNKGICVNQVCRSSINPWILQYCKNCEWPTGILKFNSNSFGVLCGMNAMVLWTE